MKTYKKREQLKTSYTIPFFQAPAVLADCSEERVVLVHVCLARIVDTLAYVYPARIAVALLQIGQATRQDVRVDVQFHSVVVVGVHSFRSGRVVACAVSCVMIRFVVRRSSRVDFILAALLLRLYVDAMMALMAVAELQRMSTNSMLRVYWQTAVAATACALN